MSVACSILSSGGKFSDSCVLPDTRAGPTMNLVLPFKLRLSDHELDQMHLRTCPAYQFDECGHRAAVWCAI